MLRQRDPSFGDLDYPHDPALAIFFYRHHVIAAEAHPQRCSIRPDHGVRIEAFSVRLENAYYLASPTPAVIHPYVVAIVPISLDVPIWLPRPSVMDGNR